MYGRYGVDQLTQGLVILSLFLTVLTMFLRVNLLILISYIPFLYAIYRVLSKNINKRLQENAVYLRFIGSLREKFKNIKLATLGTKTHKYYRCSKCGQMIRVPRGKGKISITCPKCRTEFIKRS